MKGARPAASLLLLLGLGACVSPDPRVRAAEDFRDTAFSLVAKDEEQQKKLNSLHLGMSTQDVLSIAGPPITRESRDTERGTKRELWVYNGELKQLGTLTFENGELVQILTQ